MPAYVCRWAQSLGGIKGTENLVKIFLTLLVTLISACYVFYGAAVLVSKDAPLTVILFGLVSVSYGVLAFIAVITILVSNKSFKILFVNTLGAIFLALFLVGALDSGIISAHELWGFAMASFSIIINWLSLKKLASLKYPPNKSLSSDTLPRTR